MKFCKNEPAPLPGALEAPVQLEYGELCQLWIAAYGPAVTRAQAAKLIDETHDWKTDA